MAVKRLAKYARSFLFESAFFSYLQYAPLLPFYLQGNYKRAENRYQLPCVQHLNEFYGASD